MRHGRLSKTDGSRYFFLKFDLGLSRIGFTENCQKQNEWQFCGCKSLVDERARRRTVRLVRADRKAAAAQITTLYNGGT